MRPDRWPVTVSPRAREVLERLCYHLVECERWVYPSRLGLKHRHRSIAKLVYKKLIRRDSLGRVCIEPLGWWWNIKLRSGGKG